MDAPITSGSDSPLSLFTVDDLFVEIARRNAGAVLLLRDRDGNRTFRTSCSHEFTVGLLELMLPIMVHHAYLTPKAFNEDIHMHGGM